MSYNLIGLSGAKGSGKDEVAKMIQKETIEISVMKNTGYLNTGTVESKWQIKRFSQKLKEAVALLFGVTVDQLEDQDFKENMCYSFETGILIRREDLSPDVNVCTNIWLLKTRAKYHKTNITVSPIRFILQYFGTEIGRDMLGQNFWVNATFQYYNKDDHFIVPDMRFSNELEAIKSRGGLLIRIERPGLDLLDQHPSETSLNEYKDWNEVIVNDGTLEDLREKVKEIVKKYNL